MKIELETSSYNERRYGKPWIAAVDFSVSPPAFSFGTWIGGAGEPGIRILDGVEPGDIVAMGQKDNRNPKYSAPSYHIVDEFGNPGPGISKAEAYKHWKATRG